MFLYWTDSGVFLLLLLLFVCFGFSFYDILKYSHYLNEGNRYIQPSMYVIAISVSYTFGHTEDRFELMWLTILSINAMFVNH